MENQFDSGEYFKDLAEEVINNFTKANKATTPVLVGSAKENEIRKKLQLIFPSSIGIGSGCIIDTNKYTSKQSDIVIYENDICPVFSINDTPETTYYPCEGVIAVGEVKSTLNTKELRDSFNKIESVKLAQRVTKDSILWRSYCSRQRIHGSENERFDQINNEKDEIFGFILCESFGLKIDTLLEKIEELIGEKQNHLLPNLLVSINDGIVVYLDTLRNSLKNSVRGATHIYHTQPVPGNFQFLLTKLNQVITSGRSVVELPFERYVSPNQIIPPMGSSKKI